MKPVMPLEETEEEHFFGKPTSHEQSSCDGRNWKSCKPKRRDD